MTRVLSSKQQQALAVTVLIAAMLIFSSITALPLWSANVSRQENIQLLRERLVRLQKMADQDGSLRPRLERLKHAQINDGHYLKSNTESVAAAELQRLVKSITGRNQVSVNSTQILSATEDRGFVRIAVKVRLRGSLRGLVESFYDMESNETFLFLDNLVLRDASRRRSQAATAAKPIDAEFEISAYMVGAT
jgi:hypothetical protein